MCCIPGDTPKTSKTRKTKHENSTAMSRATLLLSTALFLGALSLTGAFTPLNTLPRFAAAPRRAIELRCAAENGQTSPAAHMPRRGFAKLAGAAFLAFSGAGGLAFSPEKASAAAVAEPETILVVGGKGMVGTQVLTQLLQQGKKVRHI